MAICLFGGTFNPFHNGHLAAIQHVKKALNLDRVILFPCAIPPHKSVEILASAKDRLDMVTASIQGMSGFESSDVEFRRKGPSFTIDTVNEFLQIYSDGLFLLVGADSFLGMDSWERNEQIFQKVSIIVMPRQDQRDMSLFFTFIDEKISTGYRWKKDRFVHETMQDIIICPVPRIDISSTMVRDRISRGEPIHDLVPAGVADIIEKKELYR